MKRDEDSDIVKRIRIRLLRYARDRISMINKSNFSSKLSMNFIRFVLRIFDASEEKKEEEKKEKKRN